MVASLLTSTIARITSISHELTRIEEQHQQDEQRMHFVLNADTARLDFYEICSQKKEHVRRIIINSEADIIFDSEHKVQIDSASGLPDFDETDTKFSHVVPDTNDGRDYYRRLRGLQRLPKIIKDVPRLEREEMRKQLSEVAKEEARQLRQVIVNNFREQDDLERQNEITEILMRREIHTQKGAELRMQKGSLQLALMQLHKDKREEELKRKQDEEVDHEARRKREYDRDRIAWFDRLSIRMHAEVENGTKDAADQLSSIDPDTSQQPQKKTCVYYASNITEDTMESVDDDDFSLLESRIDSRQGSCSLKDDCARSDASTCDDLEERSIV